MSAFTHLSEAGNCKHNSVGCATCRERVERWLKDQFALDRSNRTVQNSLSAYCNRESSVTPAQVESPLAQETVFTPVDRISDPARTKQPVQHETI
jgi:hypothetical protein